jgi:hypothetical protein
MFADTDAIRTFGTANSAQAADLAAVAAALSSTPDASARAMLGPVGARFVAALAEAAMDAARSVAALGERLAAGQATAYASAATYEDADHLLGTALTRL